jgi:hypothetical protein
MKAKLYLFSIQTSFISKGLLVNAVPVGVNSPAAMNLFFQ